MSLGFKIHILVVEMAVDIGHFPTEKGKPVTVSSKKYSQNDVTCLVK